MFVLVILCGLFMSRCVCSIVFDVIFGRLVLLMLILCSVCGMFVVMISWLILVISVCVFVLLLLVVDGVMMVVSFVYSGVVVGVLKCSMCGSISVFDSLCGMWKILLIG